MVKKTILWRLLLCPSLLMLSASLNLLSAQIGPNDDFDGDGIINSIDIDDDNDGVPDAVESPSCFYLASEWNTGIKPATNGVVVSSGLTTTIANFGQLLDNVTATTAVTFTPSQAMLNANVYLFTFDHAVKLDALYLKFNTATQFGGTTKIQGSNTNNGSDWVDLSAAISTVTTNTTANGSVSVATSIKYPVTLNATTAYKYIRITGAVAANTSATAQNAAEVYFDFNIASYVASYYPKATCTDANIDGDGMLPHYDLDSDGDGCSDAYEAGATTNLSTNYQFTGAVGTNGLNNTLETSDNGIINYTSTYHAYAQSSSIAACRDTDGDGILDINDIDDDNDGVPDVDEQVSTACSVTNCSSWVAPPTAAGTTAPATIIVDGEEVSYTVTSATAITPQNLNGYALQCIGGTISGLGNAQRVDAIQTVTFNFSKPVTNFQIVVAAVQNAGAGLEESFQITTNNTTGQQSICKACTRSGVSTINSQSLKIFGMGTDGEGEVFRVNGPAFTTITITITSVGGAYLMGYGLCALKSSPTPAYEDQDTDNDGIPNRLDLDSDGDGCSDLKEAGVSPLTDLFTPLANNNVGTSYGIANPANSQLNPNGTDVNNDGLNDSVDSDVNGSPNYSTSYNPMALSKVLNACIDTDGDTIGDIVDIDDDNDGILDIIESPTCFFTLAELKNSTVYATSDLYYYDPSNPFSLAIDGDTTTWANVGSGMVINRNLIEYSLPLGSPLPISTVTVQIGINNAFLSSSFQLQGWTGNSWEVLSVAQPMNTANTTYTFTNTVNPSKAYNKFRIRGLAGGVTNGTRVHEINFTFGQAYIPQLKPTCSNDIDNDGIPNYLDLDSDGDGCPDAREAGVSANSGASAFMSASGGTIYTGGIPSGTANAYVGNGTLSQYGANGFFNGIETSAESGIYKGTYTYQYATGNNISVCADTDGDGINDIDDIDDDNDGVLDAVESPTCFYTETEAKNLANGTVTSDFTWNTTNPLTFAYDGTTTNIAWVGVAVTNIQGLGLVDLVLPTQKSVLVSNVQVAVGVTGLSSSATALWRLEGWDGAAWISLSATQAMNTASTTYTFNNTLQPTEKYARYRIAGASTTAGIPVNGRLIEVYINYNNFIPSANPKLTCINDIDGDGIPNHHDLDSDGDSCPDTKEAILYNHVTEASIPGTVQNGSGGVVTSTNANVANAMVPGPYGSNGFADALQLASNPDAYKYVYTYQFVANTADVSTCSNKFLYDIDSDDDGIPDAVESPSCFYTEVQAMDITEGVTSDFGWATANPLANTYDDNATSYGAVNSTASIQNQALITFDLPVIDAWFINNVTLNTGNAFGLGKWKLQGLDMMSNTWTDLSAVAGQAMNGAGTYTFSNTLQPTVRYHTYRIIGIDNVNIVNAARLIEFSIQYNNYNPSFHRTKMGCNSDLDGDGVPNYIDRDSDGDGCPDAIEAGIDISLLGPANFFNIGGEVSGAHVIVTGAYGANGMGDSVETTPDSGIVNYISTYNLYARNAGINLCTDTDNDGVPDIFDLDDDNDGILDSVESPKCFYTPAEATSNATAIVSTPISGTTIGSTAQAVNIDMATLHNGNIMTTTVENHNVPASALTSTSSVIYNFQYPTLVGLSQVVINSGTTNWGTGYFAVLEGSSDGVSYDVLSAPTNIQVDDAVIMNTKKWPVTLNTNKLYMYYRIRVSTKGAGNSLAFVTYELTGTLNAGTYIPSAHPKPTCTADLDGDGLLNHHDLDSDGDGCSDAVEGGASFTAANLQASLILGGNTGGTFTGIAGAPPVTQNLGNTVGNTSTTMGVPTIAGTGQAVYMSQEKYYQECTDFDGDGVSDIDDIDDDNDGVLDVIESPSCYYNVGEVSSLFTITSGLTSPDDDQSDNDIQMLHNNLTTDTFHFSAGQTYNFATIFTLKYAFGAQLSSVTINKGGNWPNASGKLQGSQDEITWVDLDTNFVALTGTGSTAVFNVVQNAGIYKYYRITGSGIAVDATTYVSEVSTSVANPSIVSLLRKPNCLNDTDGDGVDNQFDYDSDGDGCTDASESGTVAYALAQTGGQTSAATVVNTSGTTAGVVNAIVGNNTPSDYSVNGFYNKIESSDLSTATYTGTYAYSNANNALIATCSSFCYKPAVTVGTILDTKQGITSLQRAGTDNDNWPMVRKGAWTALESKTKGFVPNRLTIAQINSIPATNLVEGMMVFNITSDCLYINTDGTATGWKCFNTQTCP